MVSAKFRKAVRKDIDLLVEQRLLFLDIDDKSPLYSELRSHCYAYFQKAFNDNGMDAVIAEDNGQCIGTGIVFYYASVPSVFNITGKNAYITSMYVAPSYRRRGIGSAILQRVIEAASKKGYEIIMLNASEMGKAMYEKMGFTQICNGMILRMKG